MAGLPAVSGSQVVRAFQRAGWTKDRQHGSHVILVKTGHAATLSVPLHRELAPGRGEILSMMSRRRLTELEEFGKRDS